MKRQRIQRTPGSMPYWMMVLVGVAVSDCTCKGRSPGVQGIAAPVLDGELASVTNVVALPVSGSAAAATTVWVHYEHEENAQTLVELVGDDGQWSAQLSLRETENRFVFFASRGNSTSQRTDAYTVTVDTVARGTPSVAPWPTAISLDDGTTVDLEVTKEADASLYVNGEETAGGGGEGQTSVTVSVTVAEGANTYDVVARDEAGNESGTVTVDIFGSTVALPTLNPVTTPTRQSSQVIGGTKPAGSSVLVAVGDAAGVEVAAASPATDWSYTLALAEGANLFGVYTIVGGSESARLRATIVRDSIAPPQPFGIQLDGSDITPGQEHFTGETSVTFTGSLPADGTICVRRDPEPECVPGDGPGGDFTSDVGLEEGSNILCFSAVDAAGNGSDEVCFPITKTPGPSVVIQQPEPGAVVEGSTLEVVVLATGAGGETTGEAAVASARACVVEIDTGTQDCTDMTANGAVAGRFDATVDLSGLEDGKDYQLVVVATNGVGTSTTEPSPTASQFTFTYTSGQALNLSTEFPEASENLAIAKAASGLHVVWEDSCLENAACPFAGSGTQPPDIFYRKKQGAWSEAILVSQIIGDGISEEPAVAVDSDGLVHVVWVEQGNVDLSGDDADIVHRTVSADGTLGTPTVIGKGSDESGGIQLSDSAPALAADDDGNVHLVWARSNAAGVGDIYHAKWSNGTWDTETIVSDWDGDGNSQSPDVGVDDSGNAHVVWQDCVPCPGNGTDANTDIDCSCDTLTATVSCTNDDDCGGEQYAGVCCGSGAHCTLAQCVRERDNEIYHRIIDADPSDNDVTKVSDERDRRPEFTTFGDGNSLGPTVAVDGDGNAWIFWQDDGFYQGRQASSTVNVAGSIRESNGATYTFLNTISHTNENTVGAPAASVGADGQTVVVVWPQGPIADQDPFYARRLGSGLEIGGPTEINNSTGIAAGVDAAVDATALHCVWHETPSLLGGEPSSAYYKPAGLD